VSCCYKWLLGVHGVGVFFVNRRRWPELAPPWVGWHSTMRDPDWRRRDHYRLKTTAERFEPGNLAYASIYILESALERLLSVGIERIEPHVLALGGRLRRGLVDLDLPVVTPEPAPARAGNIVFTAAEPAAIEQGLRRDGVLVWASDGRVRLSVHLYNDAADVDRALEALARLPRLEGVRASEVGR
jgi:selenocysteine lyase/cysteine desulfurase